MYTETWQTKNHVTQNHPERPDENQLVLVGGQKNASRPAGGRQLWTPYATRGTKRTVEPITELFLQLYCSYEFFLAKLH